MMENRTDKKYTAEQMCEFANWYHNSHWVRKTKGKYMNYMNKQIMATIYLFNPNKGLK